MLSERTNGAAAHDLLVAANAVEETEDWSDLATLPGELEGLGEALRAAGRAYERSASRVVPDAWPLDRGVCSRYQRAAARWPASPPPSHERFAAALASLHAAGDAARLAARSCDRARQAVDVLLTTPTPS
jgi:hypothetical protein